MAPPGVPGGRRAPTCGGGGSRWLPRARGRLAWEAGGPAGGGGCAAGAAGSRRAAQTPAAGCCPAVRSPAPPRRALPAPGPAQPRPGRVLFRLGGSWPGGARPGSAMETRGRGRVGWGRGRPRSPAASPPVSLGGGPEGAGRGEAGLGGPGRPLTAGLWLRFPPPPASPSPPRPSPAERPRGDRCPPAARAGPGTRERVRRCGARARASTQRAAGGSPTFTAESRRRDCSPHTRAHAPGRLNFLGLGNPIGT